MGIKYVGKRSITVDLPIQLFNMYAKLCVDLQISKTEGFIRYLKWVNMHKPPQRRLLNEHTESDFKLDEGEPK
jgi:hypothetical protein